MSLLTDLPDDLPVPLDDGACNHLVGEKLPSIKLNTTEGRSIDFSSLKGFVVLYVYPMTGQPDVALPIGWDQIPGARGCTPQACSFRDHYLELQAYDSTVFGVSTQSTEYQAEAANRLHLPFPLVSDVEFQLIRALSLPTMEVDGMLMGKRVTLIAYNGIIEKVFYPVFPPNENANQVIAYLSKRKA